MVKGHAVSYWQEKTGLRTRKQLWVPVHPIDNCHHILYFTFTMAVLSKC